MAIFEGSAGSIAVGAVVGLAAAVLAPVLLPVIVNVGRPMLKGAIKGAIVAYGRGQEVVGELGETIEDLTAEARDEMRSTNRRTAPAAAARGRNSGSRARRKRTARQAEAATA